MDVGSGREFVREIVDPIKVKVWSDDLSKGVVDSIWNAYPIWTGATSVAAIRANKIKEQFRELHADLMRKLPKGRVRSLTTTALEEASMWAVKAVYQDIKEDN